MMRVLLVVGICACLCLVGAQNRPEENGVEDCPECDRKDCPKLDPTECVAGILRDRCGCCQVCAPTEGETCDVPGSPYFHGPCGDNLECISGKCKCMHKEMLCGTNGKTYPNLCRLMAFSIKTDDRTIKVDHMGACEGGPKIVSEPDSTHNVTGDNVALTCEAAGFPIPYIAWLFTRADGETTSLPGDDDRVSMIVRGGPEKLQITGWLQIMSLQKRHEGDYTCVVTNKHGTSQSIARIKVLEKEEVLERTKRLDE